MSQVLLYVQKMQTGLGKQYRHWSDYSFMGLLCLLRPVCLNILDHSGNHIRIQLGLKQVTD